MALIQNLDINLRIATKGLKAGIAVATSGLNGLAARVKSVGANIASGLGNAFRTAAKAASIAFLAIGASAVYGLKTAMSDIDSLAKSSDKLGVSTEALAALRYQAGQAGVEITQLETAMAKMARNVSDAAKGEGEAKDAFEELGLSAASLRQQSPDQQLATIADALNLVGNSSDRVRLSMEIFGRAGTDLIPLLQGGSEAMADYRQEAEKLGLTLSRDQAKKVEEANDAWDTLKQTLKGAFVQLATVLAPAIRNFAIVLTNWKVSSRLAVNTVALGFISFSMDMVHLFGVVIPTAIIEFGTFLMNYFGDLVYGIGDTFDELFDYIASWGDDPIEIDWGAVEDGISDALANIKNSLERQPLDIELRLVDQIGRDIAELKKEIKAADAPRPDGKQDDDKGESKKELDKTKDLGLPALLQRGTQETTSFINKLKGTKDALDKERNKLLKDIKKAIDKQQQLAPAEV